MTYGGWLGGSSDTRKNLVMSLEGSYYRDTALNASTDATLTTKWKQSTALNHSLAVGYHVRIDDTQYLETVDLASRPGGIGIGGLSYVFGDINQKTYDLTLRSSILFTRNQSLELYMQPYLSVGNYSRVRELLHPDSYDLYTYLEPGYEASNFDFSYAQMNINVVYRWEYRPGSTFFFVWTQGRNHYDERDYHSNPNDFNNTVGHGELFRNEPENTLLAKITYWFAI